MGDRAAQSRNQGPARPPNKPKRYRQMDRDSNAFRESVRQLQSDRNSLDGDSLLLTKRKSSRKHTAARYRTTRRLETTNQTSSILPQSTGSTKSIKSSSQSGSRSHADLSRPTSRVLSAQSQRSGGKFLTTSQQNSTTGYSNGPNPTGKRFNDKRDRRVRFADIPESTNHKSRHACRFRRSSPFYQPGRWADASGEGHLNTSDPYRGACVENLDALSEGCAAKRLIKADVLGWLEGLKNAEF